MANSARGVARLDSMDRVFSAMAGMGICSTAKGAPRKIPMRMGFFTTFSRTFFMRAASSFPPPPASSTRITTANTLYRGTEAKIISGA